MPNFEHDYLVFDEFGLKEVLCMSCSKTIKTRTEIKSNFIDERIIRELSKHSDYREIPIILESGKLAFIMVCDGCKFVSIGEDEAKNITNQLSQALKMQLEYEGKLPDLIEEVLKVDKHIVLRKAEVAEVTAALRGA